MKIKEVTIVACL